MAVITIKLNNSLCARGFRGTGGQVHVPQQ